MSAVPGERTETPRAIPVRHPGRVVAVVIVVLLCAMLVHQIITNKAFDWGFTFAAMAQPQVIDGYIKGTLLVTIGAMVLGVGGGVLLAVMRMSPNPVLRAVSFAYAWFFRAIPRYVLLAILGAAGAFFPGGIGVGIPYDKEILALFGIDGSMRIATLDANQIFSSYVGAVLGMALSEAAYMAEIARSGIISVDRGQTEAAQALGMNQGQTMWRIVLPQAMRVIVPPTGNETIAMFKDTSLLVALPLVGEMFYQLRAIGTNYYKMIPVFMGATIFYLVTTSVLMVGQSYLERHFGRGYAPAKVKRRGTTAVDFPASDH